MSNIATEWLINKTRYIFFLLFVFTGISSYLQESALQTVFGIFGTSTVYLGVALINQFYINKQIVSKRLIYVSVTIEILLVFILKYSMHFDERVGYGITMKEPATFIVYFLFMIVIALRYDRKLNLYAGILAMSTATLLLILAVADGGMELERDVVRMFETGTLRLASEIPKILFLGAFTYFISKMADFTNNTMTKIKKAEHEAHKNFIETKKILGTVESTSVSLLSESGSLSGEADRMFSVINNHVELISEIEGITGELKDATDTIKSKSIFQFETVEKNFEIIREFSGLMEQIHRDSTEQSGNATKALTLARANEKMVDDTISAISGMKDSSKRIEEISRTISEIADQTSLLSLNAAIESARAGEHGKGFAVVADEISKLATRSIDSSKEINVIINSTVVNIESASKRIEELASYLRSLIGFVKNNSSFMEALMKNTMNEFEESRKLYSSIVEVDNAAKDVLGNSESQSQHLERIFEWVSEINSQGSEVRDIMENLKAIAGEMNEHSRDMSRLLESAKPSAEKNGATAG